MVTKKAATPIYANKEDGQFREALKLYDAKQYKKALKIVDQNLKKNSQHAESLALKGCLNYQMNNKDEAESYIIKAITKEPKNFLVDHLAGIYYRGVENYPEAGKWLKASMDNGSPNTAILRDLASIQSQNRDYKNLKDSRQKYLESQPGYRANWTGVAVAHHLNQDPKSTYNTLVKIEDLIKPHLTDADRYEHSECTLYKNMMLAEQNDYAQALEQLEADKDDIRDKLSFIEYKAKYLMMLGRPQDAAVEYRRLLQRNPDNAGYYKLLETALGTLSQGSDVRLKLYRKLRQFYPKSDPAQFLPLTFLPAASASFEEEARSYVLGQLKRGVPSTFVNVKSLYRHKAKRTVIEKLVLDFYVNQVPELEKTNPTVRVWTQYFLAQSYLFQADCDKADAFIDEALIHSPTLVELYIMKARIAKHQGKFAEAADIMDAGRKLDLQDRFINSKAAKYRLRANGVDEAIGMISLFTKLDDDAVNGCKDLHQIQANWVLVESAEAYARLYHETNKKLTESSDDSELEELAAVYRSLAFKRFWAIVKVFETFYHDQYDFHSYSLRRGTPRDYVECVHWEDRIRGTPIYVRALRGLAELYFELAANKPTGETKQTRKQKKKYNKKQKEWASKIESEKEDADPFGTQLYEDALASKDILDDLLTLVKPLSEEAKDYVSTWTILFRLYVAQSKYVLALQAVKQLARLQYPVSEKVAQLKQAVQEDEGAPAAIKQVVAKGLEQAGLA